MGDARIWSEMSNMSKNEKNEDEYEAEDEGRERDIYIHILRDIFGALLL